MTTFAVLATGPSMSQEIADSVRGRFRAIAVADAFRLAPWADALVSNDLRWWNVYPEAHAFAGPKFCARNNRPGLHYLPTTLEFEPGTNSGLQGMRVARDCFKATRILLLGFDMGGTHFFGPHPAPLRNTAPHRFQHFLKQFARWRGGCEVLNCTPGSRLTQFPFADLAVLLAEHEKEAA
jgi:hypothetical protein